MCRKEAAEVPGAAASAAELSQLSLLGGREGALRVRWQEQALGHNPCSRRADASTWASSSA
jgi:hypothetical protein